MHALICDAFGPIDTLTLKNIPSPVPGPKQVRIQVKAAAVNYPDALIVQGLYQIKPRLPFSPGAEVAGVIQAVGDSVKHLKIGDEVIAMTGYGGYAEECLADANTTMPLPQGMDFETGAALVLTYATSLHALKDLGKLQPGETLVVLGAGGGVGTAAIEIGKAMGARVIAAASSAEKLALCREVGADETIDYSSENLKDRINALTEGLGADVVYDPIGGSATEAALRALNWHGRLLVVGFATGEIPKVPLNLALLKERSIIGVFWGESTIRDPKGHQANLMQLCAWFDEKRIQPRIDQRFALGEAKTALHKIFNRQVKGKVVILP